MIFRKGTLAFFLNVSEISSFWYGFGEKQIRTRISLENNYGIFSITYCLILINLRKTLSSISFGKPVFKKSFWFRFSEFKTYYFISTRNRWQYKKSIYNVLWCSEYYAIFFYFKESTIMFFTLQWKSRNAWANLKPKFKILLQLLACIPFRMHHISDLSIISKWDWYLYFSSSQKSTPIIHNW